MLAGAQTQIGHQIVLPLLPPSRAEMFQNSGSDGDREAYSLESDGLQLYSIGMVVKACIQRRGATMRFTREEIVSEPATREQTDAVAP